MRNRQPFEKCTHSLLLGPAGRPAKLPGRQTSVEGGAFATHYNAHLIYCMHMSVHYIIFHFLCNIFAITQTLIFASNKLPSVSCHCYIERQTFVYTLRHSQVFHVLATWGVETCYTILHNATWGVETERSRAEKSQAVSAVTAMTGGG